MPHRIDRHDRLALHVGTHERAVRIVVLKERNERCRNEMNSCGANVDKVTSSA